MLRTSLTSQRHAWAARAVFAVAVLLFGAGVFAALESSAWARPAQVSGWILLVVGWWIEPTRLSLGRARRVQLSLVPLALAVWTLMPRSDSTRWLLWVLIAWLAVLLVSMSSPRRDPAAMPGSDGPLLEPGHRH